MAARIFLRFLVRAPQQSGFNPRSAVAKLSMAEVDRAASGLMMLTLGGFGPPRVLAMGSLLQVNNDAWTCLVLNVQHASVGRMLYYNLPPISSVTLAESRRKGDNHLSYPIVNLDAPVPPKSKTKSKSVGPFA